MRRLAALLALIPAAALAEVRRPLVVVLDPGHGGAFPHDGAHGHGHLVEKNVALSVALRTKEAMEQAGVKRLILVSAFGVGDSFNDASAIQKFFFRTVLRSIYGDKATADAMIEASPLQWTIVRPVALANTRRTGNYRVGEQLKLSGFPRVSRADVADFMIRELNEQRWVRKTVVIA